MKGTVDAEGAGGVAGHRPGVVERHRRVVAGNDYRDAPVLTIAKVAPGWLLIIAPASSTRLEPPPVLASQVAAP